MKGDDRASIMTKLTAGSTTGRLVLLSVLLVALTTWMLFELQVEIMGREHTRQLRPFTMGYLVPVMTMIIIGGRWFGRLTLALSGLMTAFVLVPPFLSMRIARPRDWVELAFLLIVGEVLGWIISSVRQDMALMEDVEQSPFTLSLLQQVKDATKQVPGVIGLGKFLLRRHGLEYIIDADVYVDPAQTVGAGQVIAMRVEEDVRRVYSLIGDVKVRLRPIE